MYGAVKSHEAHFLKQAGLSIRETAEKTGLSPSTVKRVLNEPPVQTPDDRAAAKARAVGRPDRPRRIHATSRIRQRQINRLARPILDRILLIFSLAPAQTLIRLCESPDRRLNISSFPRKSIRSAAHMAAKR